MDSEIPPKPRRLTLVPSDEDLRNPIPPHTAAPSITEFRTAQDPNSVRHNENAGPIGTNGNQSSVDQIVAESYKQEKPYEPYSTVTTLPTSSTAELVARRPTTCGSPLSTRRMESFYSCRDTSSPVPPYGGDSESVYTLDADERRGFVPPPLNLREKRRSLSPGEVLSTPESTGDRSVFGHGQEHPVAPAELVHLNYIENPSVHPAHRGVAPDNVPGRQSSIARSYAKLISNGSMERRETDRGGALADAAEAALEESRKRNEDEMERQMRDQQQKKISDATTATAVSSSSHAPDRVGGEKKFDFTPPTEPARTDLKEKTVETSAPAEAEIKYKTFRTFFMGIIVSMGGLIFGYGGIGQIGGFLNMPDYIARFGNETRIDGARELSAVRTGTIVGLLMIGALIGSLIAAPITDRFGRKWCIALWAGVFIVGQVIEIATQRAWYQLVVGRTIEGVGIGGLSILTPLYMGEIAPKQIRGVMISCYQLFITTGILLASLVNLGTHKMTTQASWRITMGISLVWPSIMAIGVLFLDESPRWDYRNGNTERAERTIAKTYTVQPGHSYVTAELQGIQTALNAETAAVDVRWYDVFKAPTMLRRIAVGMTLQMLQQLTGINYFFSYATVLFKVAGVGDGYVTSVILGTVNFVATFAGLWVAGNVGHRKALIIGGLWISVCLFIYAATGTEFIDGKLIHNSAEVKRGGAVLVVFTCFAIVGFATTWGPLPWAVCAEIYPAQYRATSMAFSTASNWVFNFLIAFCTPFITKAIGFKFGYVFAAALLAGAFFVFAMVHETKDKSLEAIDQMILDGVKPWKSAQKVAADRKDDA